MRPTGAEQQRQHQQQLVERLKEEEEPATAAAPGAAAARRGGDDARGKAKRRADALASAEAGAKEASWRLAEAEGLEGALEKLIAERRIAEANKAREAAGATEEVRAEEEKRLRQAEQEACPRPRPDLLSDLPSDPPLALRGRAALRSIWPRSPLDLRRRARRSARLRRCAQPRGRPHSRPTRRRAPRRRARRRRGFRRRTPRLTPTLAPDANPNGAPRTFTLPRRGCGRRGSRWWRRTRRGQRRRCARRAWRRAGALRRGRGSPCSLCTLTTSPLPPPLCPLPVSPALARPFRAGTAGGIPPCSRRPRRAGWWERPSTLPVDTSPHPPASLDHPKADLAPTQDQPSSAGRRAVASAARLRPPQR